jgi:hypothetical protein
MFNTLRESFGENAAQQWLEYVQGYVASAAQEHSVAAATKVDVLELKSELEIKLSQLDLKIEQVKSDLDLKIEQVKSDLLKWILGLVIMGGFIALAGMILGLYFRK